MIFQILYEQFYKRAFSDFQPAYMGMDADGMDYPNGSELGEIFAALESLKQELQVSITKSAQLRLH